MSTCPTCEFKNECPFKSKENFSKAVLALEAEGIVESFSVLNKIQGKVEKRIKLTEKFENELLTNFVKCSIKYPLKRAQSILSMSCFLSVFKFSKQEGMTAKALEIRAHLVEIYLKLDYKQERLKNAKA